MLTGNAQVWSNIYGYGTVLKWHDFDHVVVRFEGEEDPIICNAQQIRKVELH